MVFLYENILKIWESEKPSGRETCFWLVIKNAIEKQITKKWDCTNIEVDSTIVCPVCKKEWNVLDNDTQDFDYCPKCGQKMK